MGTGRTACTQRCASHFRRHTNLEFGIVGGSGIIGQANRVSQASNPNQAATVQPSFNGTSAPLTPTNLSATNGTFNQGANFTVFLQAPGANDKLLLSGNANLVVHPGFLQR